MEINLHKVSFAYYVEGLRTSKTVNGEKTVFVWDGDQVVMELSEGGKVQKRYIRGHDLVFADGGENTEKTYYVTDTHGNVVQLLDETGNVTKTYEYDSFGNEVNPDKKDDNPFRYCGEYYDKETEEIYLRARYYQPSVGRFITRDTYTGVFIVKYNYRKLQMRIGECCISKLEKVAKHSLKTLRNGVAPEW